jgi:hypothetical protein
MVSGDADAIFCNILQHLHKVQRAKDFEGLRGMDWTVSMYVV